MEQLFIPGRGGYDIPLRLCRPPGPARLAVLIVHGFGSNKDGSTAALLCDSLAAAGAVGCALDLPGHGRSPSLATAFTVENCLADIATAADWLRQAAPGAEIAFFGSSFGAYLLSLHLAAGPHAGSRAVLRCAALTMYELLRGDMEREPRLGRELAQTGQVWLNEFDRPLLLTQGLLDELRARDPFRLCQPGLARLLMIHGTRDEEAPLSQARRFARQVQAPLLEIDGAGHRFDGPGQMERVVAAAIEFYNSD